MGVPKASFNHNHMLKKTLLFALVSFGLVWTYYWYVRGIKLLLAEEDVQTLQPYASFAVRLPEKTAAGPRWESATPLPVELTAAEAVTLGSSIYVIGGLDAFGRSVAAVRAFDVLHNSWSDRAPLPKPLQNVAAAAYGGRIYVFGGFAGLTDVPSNSVYIYEASTDSWSSGRKMPQATGAAAAVTVGDAIHVLGGFSQGQSSDMHYIYDPALNSWRQADALISGRDRSAVLNHDGLIYVFGGRQGSVLYPIADTAIYSPGNDSWDDFPHMPVKRANGGVAEVNGQAYLFCGETATTVIGQVDALDFENRSWSQALPMPTPRQGCAVASYGGRIFVIGGGRKPVLSVSSLNEVFVP